MRDSITKILVVTIYVILVNNLISEINVFLTVEE